MEYTFRDMRDPKEYIGKYFIHSRKIIKITKVYNTKFLYFVTPTIHHTTPISLYEVQRLYRSGKESSKERFLEEFIKRMKAGQTMLDLLNTYWFGETGWLYNNKYFKVCDYDQYNGTWKILPLGAKHTDGHPQVTYEDIIKRYKQITKEEFNLRSLK
jgi:hypothetical protein